MKFLSLLNKTDISRLQTSNTLHHLSLSIVSVYVPIFLLAQGYSLSKTITFFIVFHATGLIFAITMASSLIKSFGPVRMLKIYYPLEIIFFIFLNLLPALPYLFWFAAIIGGLATFSYFVPINILFVKLTEVEKIGKDLGMLLALPQIFGILGPIISAAMIPLVGFWPIFALVILGLAVSYIPLMGIKSYTYDNNSYKDFRLLKIWKKLWERKTIYVLEVFDNILEESEWFWAIFVFIVLGSLETPGIIGSLQALGGALFTLLVGKYANKKNTLLIPIATMLILLLWVIKIFTANALTAYIVTLSASFAMTLFFVTYFSTIYRKIKNRQEEEFVILREIPTVFGRFIVFGTILLTINEPRLFFMLPVMSTLALLIIFLFMKKNFNLVEI